MLVSSGLSWGHCLGTSDGQQHLGRGEQDMTLRARGGQRLSSQLGVHQIPSGYCLQFGSSTGTTLRYGEATKMMGLEP